MKRLIQKIKGIFKSLFGTKRIIRLGIYGEPNTGKTTLANKISMDWLGEPVGIVSEMPHTTRMIQRKEHVEINAGGKKLVMNLLDMPGLATQIDYKQFLKYSKIADLSDAKFNSLKVTDLKKIAKEKEITVSGKKSNIIKKLKESIDEEDLPGIVKELGIVVKKKKKKGAKYTKIEARGIAEEATKAIIEAIKWLDNVDTVLVMMDSTKDPLTQVNIMLIGNLEAKGIPIIIVANKTDLQAANPDGIRDAFPQHPVVEISALRGSNMDDLYNAIAENTP